MRENEKEEDISDEVFWSFGHRRITKLFHYARISTGSDSDRLKDIIYILFERLGVTQIRIFEKITNAFFCLLLYKLKKNNLNTMPLKDNYNDLK